MRLVALAWVLILLTGSTFVHTAVANPANSPLDLDLHVQLLDGTPVSLAEFSGKVIVLNFWASWCFPCRYEMPLLQKVHDQFKDEGLVVIAVAIDDQLPPAREFQQKYDFSFPMVFDATGVTKQAFGVSGVPETYIIDRDGKLVAFDDPRTGQSAVMINDPTVWEGPEIKAFLADLVGR